ncbi:MAG: alpha-E domain-containing protein [Paracoccaceae bacterium]
MGHAMLSRVAEGLFWLSRYIERAETVARLLDAGRRLDTLPGSAETRAAEWGSIVIASGCSGSFPRPIAEADGPSVAHHLILDDDNPSSIRSCFRQARANARAIRPEITSDVWDAVNDAWSGMKRVSAASVVGSDFAEFLDWTKTQGHRFRGAIDDTLLRTPGYDFIELGKFVERGDATARLLDVKSHLIGIADESAVARDQLLWGQILMAAQALRAYRHVYRTEVTGDGVVHFLVLNPILPRSLSHCVQKTVRHLGELRSGLGQTHRAHALADRMQARLETLTVRAILDQGVHEFLTEFVTQNHRLALEIASAYGFGGATVASQSQSQG